MKKYLATVAATVVACGLFFAGVAYADNEPARPPEPRSSPRAITPSPELLYKPVTPCRIVDTRQAVGPITPGQTRSYYVGGTTGFAPQGGKSGGCGIPTGAQVVTATITAVSPQAKGFMRAWAAGQSEPQATVLNYANTDISTTVTVPLRSGAGTDLSLKNYNATTGLVIDVSGYYIQQMQAYIDPSGSVIDQSGRLVSATKTATGTYQLVWDRDISSCSGQASSDLSGYIESVYTSGTISHVYVYNNAGTASDYWVNVVINC